MSDAPRIKFSIAHDPLSFALMGAVAIDANPMLPPGKQVLWRNGAVVWFGDLGAPIEDVDFDRVTLAPQDYESLSASTR